MDERFVLWGRLLGLENMFTALSRVRHPAQNRYKIFDLHKEYGRGALIPTVPAGPVVTQPTASAGRRPPSESQRKQPYWGGAADPRTLVGVLFL